VGCNGVEMRGSDGLLGEKWDVCVDGEDIHVWEDQDCAHAEWVFAFGECGGVCEDGGDGEDGRGEDIVADR